MKIDNECINHNAFRLISDILKSKYELIEEDNERTECGYLLTLTMLGEIEGVVKMADAMKEVLNT